MQTVMNQMRIFSNIALKCGPNHTFTHHLRRTLCSSQDTKQDMRDPLRDRSRVITPEQSIRYLKSTAFKETYAHHKVWQLFRRNFKGQYSPYKSRSTCIIDDYVYTSNPCPICRDQYLVLHYTNMDLLNHFINPHSGYVYENTILCLCAKQYEQLLVAITLAKDCGLLTFEVPLRTYDYHEYYKHLDHNHHNHHNHNHHHIASH